MTTYSEFNSGGGAKLRSIFNNDNKLASVLQSDMAFKMIGRPSNQAYQAYQPYGLITFKGKYFAYGNLTAASTMIFSSSSLTGPWVSQNCSTSIINATASTNEILFHELAASNPVNANLVSSDGISFTQTALSTIPAYRSHHYVDGLWIAIGYGTSTSTSIYTSTDNRTYTARTVPKSFGTNAFLFTSVIKFNDKIVVSYGAGIESVYTTDLTSGATWVASNQTSIPLNFSDVLGTGASTHSLVVVGAKLFRFVNTGGSYDDGALWYEYTLDGITWQGAKKVELGFSKIDPTMLARQYCEIRVLSNGNTNTQPKNGVTIDNKGYVLVQVIKDAHITSSYNYGVQLAAQFEIGVLQILEDGTISYITVEARDMLIANGQAPNFFFGTNSSTPYNQASLLVGLNNELLVIGGPGTNNSSIMNGIYVADMDAQELVLESQ